MNHNHSQSGGHTSHLILMLLCCLIPIGLIFAVSIFGLSLGPLSAYLPFALVLLCPLMMFFMMRGMSNEQDTGHIKHHKSLSQARKNERSVSDGVSVTLNESDARNEAPNPAANQKSCH